MEEDLKKNENGRRPQFFFKSKTTLIFDAGRRPQFLEDEIRPHFYLNGRQPKIKCNFNQYTEQHRQPDQNNNQKYIGTTKKKSTLIDIIVN